MYLQNASLKEDRINSSWIHLAQDVVKCSVAVNTVMHLWLPQDKENICRR